MAYKSDFNLKRVNMNLPVDLVERVKAYAQKMCINTTSAYIVLLNQALKQDQTMEQLPAMLNLFNQLKNLDVNSYNPKVIEEISTVLKNNEERK